MNRPVKGNRGEHWDMRISSDGAIENRAMRMPSATLAAIFVILFGVIALRVAAETEPNDTFATANQITPGSYTGDLGVADVDDYYTFDLASNGQRVFVNVTVPGALTVNVFLYNQSHVEVGSVLGMVGGRAQIDYTLALAQTVYARIQWVSGAGTYSMEVGTPGQNDADSGGDAGNAFQTATQARQGTYARCLVKDEDNRDYYWVNLGVTSTVYVNVTVPAALTINLYLYDENQNVVDSDLGMAGGTARVSHDFTTAPMIFFFVEMVSGWGGYTLELSVPGVDSTPPTITHTPVSTGSVGVAITITATVTDNVMVDEVELNYTNVTGANQKVTMTKSGDTYSSDIPAQASAGIVTYQIEARDTSDNKKETAEFSITILVDTTPPTITHTPITSAHAGDAISISATITDNIGVQSATLFYRKKGESTYVSLPMGKSGDMYTAAIPSSAVTTVGVQYYISATDGANTAMAPQTNPTTAPYDVSVTEKAESASLLWLWIIVIIIVIIAVMLAAMMMRKKSKVPEAAPPPEEQRVP